MSALEMSSLAAKRPKIKSAFIADEALAWWDQARRALPWRALPGQTANPYHVWLSEIMLQQTGVTVVTPYFKKFLALWPRVQDLAQATPDEVIAAFAGLGYYSRARNLHACARAIAARGGDFPDNEAELRHLPGIGSYSAAAIAAIAFGRHAAPVDGNIARIFSRLYGVESPMPKAAREIGELVRAASPSARPGDFAQALMDLGASCCRPRAPRCKDCPLQRRCVAFQRGEAEAFPRRATKKTKPLREGIVYCAIRADGALLARRRPPGGLLGSTLELPGAGLGGALTREPPFAATWREAPGGVEQAFTHFLLRLKVFYARAPAAYKTPSELFWIARTLIAGAAFSSVMRKAVDCGRSAYLAANRRSRATSPSRSSSR